MVALASRAPAYLNSVQPESPQTNLRKSQATRGSKRLKRHGLGGGGGTGCVSANQQQQKSPLLACNEDPSFIYCHPISRSLDTSGRSSSSEPELVELNPVSFPQTSKTFHSNSNHSEDYNSSASEDSLLGSSQLSTCSSALSRRRNLNSAAEELGIEAGSDYASASPGCISALDYWHLNSDSPPQRRRQAAPVLVDLNQQQEVAHQQQKEESQREDQQEGLAKAADSVYLDDGQVFHNLILREGAELRRRQLQLAARRQQEHWRPLEGRQRHSLLSWMLKVCEHQLCQDEIFPLASQILDKFLLLQPGPDFSVQNAKQELGVNGQDKEEADDNDEDDDDDVFRCDEGELERRQLYLFAACSLLLAAKLRQTPRLAVQSLVEFSRLELPVELARAEILEGELLLLARLKWDLASLVTPNDFLVLLLRKCRRLLAAVEAVANQKQNQSRSAPTRCDEARVRRHTQTLLELCLMDSQLSQYPPSILAMSSMAVAIDGLSMNEKTCWRLEELVTQIYEMTHKVNELKSMIDVALKIEKYVQTLLNSAHND